MGILPSCPFVLSREIGPHMGDLSSKRLAYVTTVEFNNGGLVTGILTTQWPTVCQVEPFSL